MQDHLIVAKVLELEGAHRRTDHLRIVDLLDEQEGQHEQRVLRVNASAHAGRAAFVHEDHVVAECFGHAGSPEPAQPGKISGKAFYVPEAPWTKCPGECPARRSGQIRG